MGLCDDACCPFSPADLSGVFPASFFSIEQFGC